MNRIMVMGVSAGVGKSTFAKKLSNKLNIPVYHLDALYWKPEWVEASIEEFAENQRKIVDRNQWIIEGNYSNTFEIRAQKADVIIYLELPLYVCLYRVFKRWITNLGKTRPDMGPGCKEKIDYQFVKFICTTYDPRKSKMKTRFQAFLDMDPNKKVITLTNKKAIKLYLETLNAV